MRPERCSPAWRSAGLALPAAIFILVILSGLAVFLVRMASLRQAGMAQEFLASRAYQAARSGLEWGFYQGLRQGSCSGTQSFNAGGGLAEFTITVVATSQRYNEAGSTLSICQVVATACNQPQVGACPGTAGAAFYAERQLRASFPYP